VEGEEKLLQARLDLSADEYAKAIRAHALNRIVMLKGVFHRGVRTGVIRDHREFEVIDEAAERHLTEAFALHETPPSHAPPKPPPDAKK
jgi:hypothetical protein